MTKLGKHVATGKRRWITVVVTLLVIAGGLLVALDRQHRFDFESETLEFSSGGNQLDGTLHLPPRDGTHGDGPHGVILFVGGDGDAETGPGPFPIWEVFADAGYATVTWNKPGIGASTGNWLDQSMDDRATEVMAVLDAVAARDDLDVTDLGVMGASQGGWVLPLVADRIDVDFFIAWSTAIEWQAQGQYLTERQLVDADASGDLTTRVRDADRVELAPTYQAYLDWQASLDPDVAEFFAPMTEARWQFVRRNGDSDARETLPAMRDVPVLLLLGGQDQNVDVDGTEQVYRDVLGDRCLQVRRYPNANHDLLDRNGLALTLTGLVQPRAIFADGVLADVERFVSSGHEC